jgi:hypothetical protein
MLYGETRPSKTSGLQEKRKNRVKRGCRCKNAGDIFDVYLANLTNTYKVKDNIWT